MKKLLMLTIIMLSSLIAFSEKGIKFTTKDSIIPIPKSVAREIAKDLIKKDSIESEFFTLKKNYLLLENNSSIKDSVIEIKSKQILLYQEKEKNYLSIIEIKEEQKNNFKELSEGLNREIKKVKIKSLINSATSTAIIVGLLYILLK